MYKMLVTDLDGTLLNDYKEIPERNIKAIQKLHRDFGIIPVIATARPLEVAKYIADKGGDDFQSYIIATNGAILQNIQTEELLINKSFSKEQLERLISVCKENNLEYEAMTTKCEVADSRYSYRRTIDPMYENMNVPFNYQNDLESYILNSQDPIPLFAVNGTEEELDRCYSELARINGLQISEQCIRTTPEMDATGNLKTLAYHDIMCEGVTKASAIQTLAKHLGISQNEIIAIGDGGNDVEMLNAAGLKIAMQNAKKSLKDMADIITPVDNNNGGVGVILEELHKQLSRSQERSFGNGENSNNWNSRRNCFRENNIGESDSERV